MLKYSSWKSFVADPAKSTMISWSVLGLVVLALITAVTTQDSEEERKEEVASSAKVLTDMYITLRNLVFPKSPVTTDAVFNRFTLLMPGKVLNYWDYFPGKNYEESLLRQDQSAPESVVPPSVMEKWFDIADVTVGADVFSGGVTATSFARIYETILSNMKILNIDSKYDEAQRKYNKALNYFTEVVSDPEDINLNVTRLALYDRYQKEYSVKKLEMEEEINHARVTMGSIDYELWFQRHYPSLNNEVESIYTKWLAFGQKDLVELYKAYLDSGSAGAEVEDARMALRASGVTSLDRTRTIYPVSFEPGNWYKYLLPQSKSATRDMILSKISLLESQRDTLTTVTNFNDENKQEADDTIETLQGYVDDAEKVRENKTVTAMNAEHECRSKRASATVVSEEFVKTSAESDGDEEEPTGPDDEARCAAFVEAGEQAVGATFQKAQISAEFQGSSFMVNSNNEYNTLLNKRIETLTQEIEKAKEELATAESYLGGIADADGFQNLDTLYEKTEQSLDESWLSFQYDSESTHISTDQEAESVSAGFSLRADFSQNRGAGISGSIDKNTQRLMQGMNSANLKVSGQVLRVVIKRPWFRPSLFDDSSLYFSFVEESSHKKVFVSPGPLTEEGIRKAVGGLEDDRYMMVEYVSSFLLARNLKLQFSGMDSVSVSQGMQLAAGLKLTGNFGLFNINANLGYNKNTQHVTADRSSTGMIINIPGAQIIGYYTNVLPRFPYSQD